MYSLEVTGGQLDFVYILTELFCFFLTDTGISHIYFLWNLYVGHSCRKYTSVILQVPHVCMSVRPILGMLQRSYLGLLVVDRRSRVDLKNKSSPYNASRSSLAQLNTLGLLLEVLMERLGWGRGKRICPIRHFAIHSIRGGEP